jgi:hypothetical protein
MAMMSAVRIDASRSALLLFVLAGGCTPAPDVVQAGAKQEAWNRTTIQAPPRSDAAPDPEPDPDPPVGGSGGTGGTVQPPDDSPDAREATVDTRPAGRDASAPADSSVDPSASQTCTLQFQVTTLSYGGDYSPKNVGAIWISDANAKFVKTLTLWGRRRITHLNTWKGVSASNSVDAITSATASSAGTRLGKWDCTDLDRRPVPDGTYRINVEFTESNALGRVMMPLVFTKGGGPVDVMGKDQGNFKTIHLQVGQ